MRYVDIMFDGQPGPDGPRFVEVELDGKSIRIGEWVKKSSEMWALRVLMPIRPDMLPKTSSAVDHPSHYNAHPSGVEAIDIIEHMTFNVGNSMKYQWRAGLKDVTFDGQIEDLEKARWYLDREIERLKQEEKQRAR